LALFKEQAFAVTAHCSVVRDDTGYRRFHNLIFGMPAMVQPGSAPRVVWLDETTTLVHVNLNALTSPPSSNLPQFTINLQPMPEHPDNQCFFTLLRRLVVPPAAAAAAGPRPQLVAPPPAPAAPPRSPRVHVDFDYLSPPQQTAGQAAFYEARRAPLPTTFDFDGKWAAMMKGALKLTKDYPPNDDQRHVDFGAAIHHTLPFLKECASKFLSESQNKTVLNFIDTLSATGKCTALKHIIDQITTGMCVCCVCVVCVVSVCMYPHALASHALALHALASGGLDTMF
jgi:hypothetical protein